MLNKPSMLSFNKRKVLFFISLVEVCSSSAHGPWPHRYFQALLALLCLLFRCPSVSSMRPCLSSSVPAARLRVTTPGFVARALGGVPRPRPLPPLVELSLVVVRSALGRLRSALSSFTACLPNVGLLRLSERHRRWSTEPKLSRPVAASLSHSVASLKGDGSRRYRWSGRCSSG